MREIDLNTWPRRAHFELFRAYRQPFFGVTAEVDVTAFRAAARTRGLPFTVSLTYVLARAANALPPFRWRIRGQRVVEHEAVHPNVTVALMGSDLFGFCQLEYTADFSAFLGRTQRAIADCQAHPSLEDPPGRDDLLYLSSLPWLAFTSVQHPLPDPPDSVPRITNGRFTERAGRLVMPLDVQAHHALMDGRHLGLYFAEVQRLLDDSETWLDG